jgi:Lrp/AsnC family transcriptional regulator, leucine-responsive regulatory protein
VSEKDAVSLDKRDLKILSELQENNTITYRELASRVALSPSACVTRVKQLEDEGYILGYHAAIAIDRVHPTFIMVAEISLASHVPEDIGRFDELMLSTPEVIEVLRVSGRFDYMVKFLLTDMREWQGFAHRLLAPQNKVEKMVTHVVMQELKPFRGYPIQLR